MAKRAHAVTIPALAFHGGIPDDRPRFPRPGLEGPARQRPASPPRCRVAGRPPAPASRGRLGNGQLRRQVAEWLAARPGPHTVGEIAKDLGRSAGAVGNALTTLADRGEAGREPGKPIRYQANFAPPAAAAAITSKAPSSPKPAPAPAPAPAAAPKPAAP